MWSKSIEILNPYEACRRDLEDEWARHGGKNPGRRLLTRLRTALQSTFRSAGGRKDERP